MNNLEQGIITDKHIARIGVLGLGKGSGKTFISVSLCHEISKIYGMTYYVGKATKEEIGLGKKLQKGHIYDNIYYARVTPENIERGYVIYDDPIDDSNCDIVIVVVDPLPSLILKNIGLYKDLSSKEHREERKYIWVLNKMNSGVNQNELERFLNIRFQFIENLIPIPDVYRRQYRSELLYSMASLHGIEGLAQYIVQII